ncbi:hypothetical protein HPB49_005900 [Dermacentor silvarum]|uniref:Uncharacterized protein n=1 Tax=Dermacentor silvarum TaxID=543639 RepID=A0ACB8C7I5_DERSI|nr:hypothetical protein HPB49_005900 [Dermacentor silvarum]
MKGKYNKRPDTCADDRPNTVAPATACHTPQRRPLVSSEMQASVRTTMIVDNQMCVQVPGEGISPEECQNEAGWTLAVECMSRLRQRTPASGKPNGPGGRKASPKSKFNKNVRASVITAARMPAMPLEESKAVVRPRGGLGIVKTGTTTVAAAILAAAKITSQETTMGALTGRMPAAVGERYPATLQATSCANVKDPIEEPRAEIQRQQLLQEKPQQEKKGNNIRSAQKITEATKKDDMNRVRQANETLRQEDAVLRATINKLTREIAEIRKLLLCNNEPLQILTPTTSKTEKTTPNNQETAVEEPAPQKRDVEATRKQTENDRIDNLGAKFEARFNKLEQLISVNIAAVTGMKRTIETYQAEKTNRLACIKRTLQPIVSHPANSVHDNAIMAANATTVAAGETASHWNCRGLGRKKAVIQQHIAHVARKPDVILLQETPTHRPSPATECTRASVAGEGRCDLY